MNKDRYTITHDVCARLGLAYRILLFSLVAAVAASARKSFIILWNRHRGNVDSQDEDVFLGFDGTKKKKKKKPDWQVSAGQ